MLTLTEHLSQASQQRNEGYTLEIVRTFPDIRYISHRVNWGVFSWTHPTIKLKQIKKSTLVILGNGPQTPSEIARDYLDYEFPARLRATGAQSELICSYKTPPLYVRPGMCERGIYVDLQAAYYSICNIYGWNVDYYPGRWVLIGKGCTNFPLRHNKVARNCLVSLGLRSHATHWNGHKFIQQSTKNRHLNLGLWTLVQDILHDIARFAADKCAAFYIHTDGYIIPERYAKDLIAYIEAWGLMPTIKAEGSTWVLGFQNWFCGDKRTKRLLPKISKDYRYIRDIPPEVVAILKDKRIRKLRQIVDRRRDIADNSLS